MRGWKYVTKRVRLDIRDTQLSELEYRAKGYGFKNVNEFLEDMLCRAVTDELNCGVIEVRPIWD